jgi:hypothetical protein
MKTTFALLSLCLFPLLCAAQENTPAPASYTVPSVWRVTFLGLGLQNETRLGPRTTLASGLAFTGNSKAKTIGPSGTTQEIATSFSFSPVIYTGVRHFYNFERRLEKQKSIRYNSGNYLSARLLYVTNPIYKNIDNRAPLTRNDGVYAEALWGFQRTYRRNFYLHLALGASLGRNGVNGTGDFSLGYTFPNRNANQ